MRQRIPTANSGKVKIKIDQSRLFTKRRMLGAHNKERANPVYICVTADKTTKNDKTLPTILDKTLDKVTYLESIFPNSVALAILPSLLSLEAVLLCLQKKA